MGHANSKPSSDSSEDDTDASNPAKPSHAQKLKQKLHLHRPHFRRRTRHRGCPSPNLSNLLREGDFAGIALLRIITVFSHSLVFQTYAKKMVFFF